MDSPNQPPKIAQRVEFIGVPGSGKTTLSARLVEALRASGEQPVTPKNARGLFAERAFLARLARATLPNAYAARAVRRLYFWQGARVLHSFQRQHVDLFAQVESWQRARLPEARANERRVVPLFYGFARDMMMLNRLMRPGERVIMDEGFAHRVVQFFVSDVEDPDYNAVRAYLRLLPRPACLIYVRAPHETCLRRVFERGLWRHFEDKDEEHIARFLQNAQSVVAFAVEELKDLGWSVITVENGGNSVEEAVEDLVMRV